MKRARKYPKRKRKSSKTLTANSTAKNSTHGFSIPLE